MEQIKYPKGEKVWVEYCDAQKDLRFIMTSKENNRDFYFLYELVGGKFMKLGKARSPKELEVKFDVDKSWGGEGCSA